MAPKSSRAAAQPTPRITRSQSRQQSLEPTPPADEPEALLSGRKRTSKSELPTLPSRSSHAYGGAGRAGSAEQIQAHAQEADFARVFGDARDSALGKFENKVETDLSSESEQASNAGAGLSPIAEDESPQQAAPVPQQAASVPQQAAPVPKQAIPVPQQAVPDPQQIARSLEQVARAPQQIAQGSEQPQLVFNPATGLLDWVYPSRQAPPPPPSKPPGFFESLGLGNGLSPFKLWFYFLIALYVFGTFTLTTTGTSDIGLRPIVAFADWSASTTLGQKLGRVAVNRFLQVPAADLARDLHDAAGHFSTVQDAIADMQQNVASNVEKVEGMFPDGIVIMTSGSRAYHIPEEFWQALKEKLELDAGLATDAKAYDAFIKSNSARLKEMVDAEVFEQTEGLLNSRRLLARHEYLLIVKEMEKRVSARLEERFDDTMRVFEATVQDVAREAARDELRGLHALTTIAASHVLTNAANALERPDFFSSQLGSLINVVLSSPTFRPPTKDLGLPRNIAQRLYALAFRPSTLVNDRIAAVSPWTELGQCWCAAGVRTAPNAQLEPPKLQLGIRAAHAVYPSSVTVEHIPRSGALDIASAPQDMELWVQIPDPSQRQAILDEVASRLRISPDEMWMERRNGGIVVPDDYVKVGVWRYDIGDRHQNVNPVQHFKLQVDFANLPDGVVVDPIRQTVVRARTNYGADNTCLYRVRLHGVLPGRAN